MKIKMKKPNIHKAKGTFFYFNFHFDFHFLKKMIEPITPVPGGGARRAEGEKNPTTYLNPKVSCGFFPYGILMKSNLPGFTLMKKL